MDLLLAALSNELTAAIIGAIAGFAGAILGAVVTQTTTFLLELRWDYTGDGRCTSNQG